MENRKKNASIIYEALLNRTEGEKAGANIVEKAKVEGITKEFNRKFKGKVDYKEIIKYLSRHNYTKRIFMRFYYVNSIDERKRRYCRFQDRELLFLVLNRLKIKWYLGSSSAFYESGEAWQAPNIISIVNNKFSGKRKILGMIVKFYKLKSGLIFAFKKEKTKNKVEYFYSDNLKTHIDRAYLRINDGLFNTKGGNEQKLKEYLKRFPKWVGKR